MQMGQATGANQAYQQSQANQMNAQIAQTQAWVDGVSGVASTAIGAGKAGMFPSKKPSSVTGNAGGGWENGYGGGLTELVQENQLDQYGNPAIPGY
jgi:hypothetical protein